MKKMKSVLAAMLAIVMIFSVVTVPVSAADNASSDVMEADVHTHELNATGVCTSCGMNVLGHEYFGSFKYRLYLFISIGINGCYG